MPSSRLPAAKAVMGVGAMIGAGIVVLTGIAAGHAGPGLILAFINFRGSSETGFVGHIVRLST